MIKSNDNTKEEKITKVEKIINQLNTKNMSSSNLLGKILKPRLKLMRGSRFVSFAFIFCSVLIAAGVLFAANMYYDIDTGEVVVSPFVPYRLPGESGK